VVNQLPQYYVLTEADKNYSGGCLGTSNYSALSYLKKKSTHCYQTDRLIATSEFQGLILE